MTSLGTVEFKDWIAETSIPVSWMCQMAGAETGSTNLARPSAAPGMIAAYSPDGPVGFKSIVI